MSTGAIVGEGGQILRACSCEQVPGALTTGFTFKYLVCGQCVGKYLQYDPSGNGPDRDSTNASFMIVPNPAGSTKGSWSVSELCFFFLFGNDYDETY